MAHLIILEEGANRRFDLKDPVVSIGRSQENAIIILERESSRRHCQVEQLSSGYKLVDLESRNGTRINGTFVNQHLLKPGDTIEIGKTKIEYVSDEDIPADTSAPQSAPMTAYSDAEGKKDLTSSRAGETSLSSRRRRLGTSSFQRRSRPRVDADIQKEKRLIKLVGIGAGVFVVLILCLILIGPLLVGSEERRNWKQTLDEAEVQWRDDPAEWSDTLRKVPTVYEDLHARAQNILGKIADENSSIPVSVEERHLQGIRDFRSHAPDKPEDLLLKCESFQRDFPESPHRQEVDDYIREANTDLAQRRTRRIDAMNEQVHTSLSKKDFVRAMEAVMKLQAVYRDDTDLFPRIMASEKRVLETARTYFDEKNRQAVSLKDRGRLDEARNVYSGLIEAFGGFKVEPLKNLCDRASLKLKAMGE